MELETYILSDQPTLCPKCGTRTDFIEREKDQLHSCPNNKCKKKFIAIEDDFYNLDYWNQKRKKLLYSSCEKIWPCY